MRIVLKVILLLLIIGLGLLFGGVIVYIVFIEGVDFEMSMLYSIGLSVLAFLSAWFHIITVKHYKLDTLDQILPRPSKLFWTTNIGFSGALILLSGYAFYISYMMYGETGRMSGSQGMVLILYMSIPLIIGAFILVESYYLRHLLKKNKDRQLILEIDDIKGNQDDAN